MTDQKATRKEQEAYAHIWRHEIVAYLERRSRHARNRGMNEFAEFIDELVSKVDWCAPSFNLQKS